MEKATPRQTFALFCATGYDVRACNLTKDKASYLISLGKMDKIALQSQVAQLSGAIQKRQTENKPKIDFEAIYNEAQQAGLQAGQDCQPIGMRVVQHSNPLDDKSPIVKSYDVSEGVCGFAWIKVLDARSSFAKWLKEHGYGKADSYAGGCNIWVHEFGQSMQRKEAFAGAFAAVLQKHGIKAYMQSRMD